MPPIGPAYLTTRYRESRIVQTPALIMFAFNDGMHREITHRDLKPRNVMATFFACRSG